MRVEYVDSIQVLPPRSSCSPWLGGIGHRLQIGKQQQPVVGREQLFMLRLSGQAVGTNQSPLRIMDRDD